MKIVLELPMPPSTNGLYPGRGRRHRSPAYEAWLHEAGWLLRSQRPPEVKGRVSILIEVGEPKTDRKTDVSNYIKATEDLLVAHRVIEGDDQRFVRRVTAEWAEIEGIRVTVESAG